jgi:hypothetical protein
VPTRDVPTADDLLAAARRSPALVAAHDRDAWVALFARDYRIDDPVGSRPVVPVTPGDRGALERFWDTFIAPNDIVFDVHLDRVRDQQVVRDVTIRTRMPGGVEVVSPAHLRYDLVVEDGAVRIARMAAHWELAPTLRTSLRTSLRPSHLGALSAMPVRMVRVQGVAGLVGFGRAIVTVGRAGRRSLIAWADAQGAELDGPIHAAGRFVSARVRIDGRQGLVFADTGPRAAIVQADLYL